MGALDEVNWRDASDEVVRVCAQFAEVLSVEPVLLNEEKVTFLLKKSLHVGDVVSN
jgi:hypothetical protein